MKEGLSLQSSLSSVSEKLFRDCVLGNRWVPKRVDPVSGRWGPSDKQALFLCSPERERLYGGAARGGKSWALLAAAAMFVDVAGYSAVIFRRHLTDHKLADGLISRSLGWWGSPNPVKGRDPVWNAVDFKWTFPSGAVVQFGFLEAESDRQRWASTAFHRIEFDELTQFDEGDYTFMASRLCRDVDSVIPLSILSATNPGDVGHEWVKDYFITHGAEKGRLFIPANLEDNHFIDRKSYEENLRLLDHVSYQRLRFGDWDVSAEGNKFKYEWFMSKERNQIVDELPVFQQVVRYWDLASTEAVKGKDPDYTAGVKMGVAGGRFYVLDVQRFRSTPSENERLIKSAAETDGAGATQYMEQEPGSAGKSQVDHYAREVLSGLPFVGVKTSGDKEIRANPFSTACEMGNVYLLRAGWNMAFINELCQFPKGSHDDQVDAASGAYSKLSGGAYGAIKVASGRRPK